MNTFDYVIDQFVNALVDEAQADLKTLVYAFARTAHIVDDMVLKLGLLRYFKLVLFNNRFIDFLHLLLKVKNDLLDHSSCLHLVLQLIFVFIF